jgi:HAD superfamily hydrolase (TIGR01509 family)
MILGDKVVAEYGLDRLNREKEEVYREMYRPHIKPIAGVMELLRAAKAAGVKCAIGSSGCRDNVEMIIEGLGIADLIDASISGSDVTHGKPHHEIFTKAHELLGLKAEECVVVEDAVNGILAGLLKLIPTYWTVAVVEVIVYTPMLGAGGTYLSFVTGNIANLKLPCAINAMEGAEVKANSEEGEVVSTIAIATSSIVTTIILAIGVIVFAPFLQSFTDNALLKPAFAQVLPALFGALGAGYFIKHWRISFFPIIIMIIVLVFAPTMGASTLLFVGIVASVGGALFMYKKGMLDRVK